MRPPRRQQRHHRWHNQQCDDRRQAQAADHHRAETTVAGAPKVAMVAFAVIATSLPIHTCNANLPWDFWRIHWKGCKLNF